MINAAHLRQQIESSLSDRMDGALSPRIRTELERMPCGVAAIDALLHGGLPAGVLTELTGTECSGRTTMAMAYVAAVTQSGGVCAWIDVADSLHPESVAANHVDLERLLWVRCGPDQQSLQHPGRTAASAGVRASGPQVAALSPAPRHTGGGSPHPRSEGKDMPNAIGAMLQAHGGLYDRQVRRERKMIGTPGMPNRPLAGGHAEREEQVNSDRLPPRRGENLALTPRCAEPQLRRSISLSAGDRMASTPQLLHAAGAHGGKPWQALDQALRATDLILQGGGFSTIVLDLGSTPAEIAWRIPLATWFRFRAACDRTRVSLLLLTQHPCARSSAELVVRLETGSMDAENKVMTGLRFQAATERSRASEASKRVVPIRKPPQSERSLPRRPGEWKSEAAWAQTK